MAASTRSQAASSSGNVIVTFFMDTKFVFPCFRVKVATRNGAGEERSENGKLAGRSLRRTVRISGVNPLRGRKLRLLFDQVDWSA